MTLVLQKEYDEEYSKLMNKVTIAEWNYNTNVTDANKDATALARDAVRNMTMKTSNKLYEFTNQPCLI